MRDLTLAVCFVAVFPLSVAAQPAVNVNRLIQVVDENHLPAPQKVVDAAIAINGQSTAIPEQTIDLGGYDGASREFLWALPDLYPPGLPAYKRQENGGDVPPQHFAPINSWKVTYRVGLQNVPSNLTVWFKLPQADGTMKNVQATMNPARTSAKVSFHPYTTEPQIISFSAPGTTPKQVRLQLYLKPQLGAFVVPHLLLAVVYEPPGSQSSSSFAMSNTVGTRYRFEIEGGSGIIKTVDTGALLGTLAEIASGSGGFLAALGNPVGWAGAGAVAPYVTAVGAVLTVIHGLEGSETTSTTEVTTTGTSQTSGWSMTVKKTYSTGVHQYPGEGDKFIILDDVLFVYSVMGSKVVLAPVAFTQDRSETISQITSELPAHYVQRVRALDAILTPPPAAHTSLHVPARFHFSLPRLQYYMTARCETQGPTSIDLTMAGYEATGTSKTVTTTTQVTHKAGWFDALLGTTSPDMYYKSSYSNSTESWEEQSQSTSITLGCPEFAPETRYVEIYVDNAFGTFLSKLAGPVPSVASLTGRVVDGMGRPAANVQLILETPTKLYAERSRLDGTFAFYTETIPPSSAKLRTPSRTVRVPFRGRRVTDLRIEP